MYCILSQNDYNIIIGWNRDTRLLTLYRARRAEMNKKKKKEKYVFKTLLNKHIIATRYTLQTQRKIQYLYVKFRFKIRHKCANNNNKIIRKIFTQFESITKTRWTLHVTDSRYIRVTTRFSRYFARHLYIFSFDIFFSQCTFHVLHASNVELRSSANI